MQRISLAELAMQCPYEYGPAVFNARAYLKACGDSLTYSNLCEIAASVPNARIIAPDGNVISGIVLNVFPNPAENSVTLSSILPDGVKGELIFYNSIGSKLIVVKLNDGESSINVDLTAYAAGLYYYKAFVNGQIVRTDKLMIIK